jgi:hypothetical protein
LAFEEIGVSQNACFPQTGGWLKSPSFTEETDMGFYLSVSGILPQPETTGFCPARAMGPTQRQDLARQALAKTAPISRLAAEHSVSRKFVSRQRDRADEAIHDAFFEEESPAERVLFHLPVTKDWIEQLILGLTLICHSSIRGFGELCRDLFNYPVSVGKIHEVLRRATTQARQDNACQDLSGVRIGAHDEIFQSGRPVLVGADVDSTYCYLLSLEDQRDADTWGLRLLELQDRGFRPEATIADAGSGLRAGQNLAMPEVSCRGDVFHALQTFQPLVTFLENRGYDAIAARTELQRKMARQRRRGQRTQALAYQISRARRAEDQAVALADDVAMLFDWLRYDVLSLAGPDHATRRELFDFIIAELHCREPLRPHHIGPIVRALGHQRDQLLAFAGQLDQDLAELAADFQLPVATLREAFHTEALDLKHPRRWPREAALRERLGGRFFAVSRAVAELAERTTRASSVIENLNSRLRGYFFLRRHLGADYLALLQFFLNHRRFLRSERPERVGKSPAELLTGQSHPHWLEMLGHARFSRN